MLNVYKVEDGGEVHHAIAESERDAAAVVVASGLCDAETVDDYMQKYEPTFTLRGSGESITVHEDDGPTTRTAAEWITKEGRSLLGSTVF